MLERFFTFFQTYRSGILFFLFSLAAVAFMVQWFAWIFAIGRFGKNLTSTGTDTGTGASGRTNLRFLVVGAIVKIVNEFRHVLALGIVLIFAFALGYSLWKAAAAPTSGETSVISNMKDALQAVAATLGGLVGSIIGYYFGESSVAPVDTRGQPPTPDSAPMNPVTIPGQSGTADSAQEQ